MSEQKTQTTRKPIQIAACNVVENDQTQCEMFLHVLCDDGTIWRLDNRGTEWSKVPSVPGDVFDAF